MFRSRTTGRITLAQLPNWLLAVWLLASAVMWLGHPQGWVHAVLVVLASGRPRLGGSRAVGRGRGAAWGEPLSSPLGLGHARLARLLPRETLADNL